MPGQRGLDRTRSVVRCAIALVAASRALPATLQGMVIANSAPWPNSLCTTIVTRPSGPPAACRGASMQQGTYHTGRAAYCMPAMPACPVLGMRRGLSLQILKSWILAARVSYGPAGIQGQRAAGRVRRTPRAACRGASMHLCIGSVARLGTEHTLPACLPACLQICTYAARQCGCACMYVCMRTTNRQ